MKHSIEISGIKYEVSQCSDGDRVYLSKDHDFNFINLSPEEFRVFSEWLASVTKHAVKNQKEY
jgi:hypothetical protein